MTIINLIAILLSPIIAVVIGEVLRKRNFEKQKRLDALYDLVAYSYKLDSDEFLQALNSLKLLFSKDGNLQRLLNELHQTFLRRDKGEVVDNRPEGLVIKIIKRVCELEGFKNIAEEDIDNLFKKL
jgi:hypothetical protein